jgi:glycerol-3-phosphate dehydrogenase (NAD(P)+)
MAGVPALAARLAPHWPDDLPLLSSAASSPSNSVVPPSSGPVGDFPATAMAALHGPNLATELAKGLPPAASVIA